MSRARIYQRSKSAMQSGTGSLGEWEVIFPPQAGNLASNTRAQLRLRFDTKEEAIAYADRNQIAYDLEIAPPLKTLKPKVYADNFRFGRSENWTH